MFFLSIVMFVTGGEKTSLTQEDFRRTITSFIDEHISSKGIEREIEFRSLPSELKIYGRTFSLRVSGAEPLAAKGYVGIPVEVLVDGKVDRVVVCSVFIRTFENVFVMVQDVNKGSVFDETWAVLKRVETTRVSDCDLITYRSQLVGMRTNRMLKKNSILRAACLEKIPDVRQNDMVSMLVKSHNVVVGAAGIAREEGCVGDEIKIQRLGSKEIVKAKIVGKNIVEVVIQ